MHNLVIQSLIFRKTCCCNVYPLVTAFWGKKSSFYPCFSCSLPFFFVGSIIKYVFPKASYLKEFNIWGKAQDHVLTWQEFSLWPKFKCERLKAFPPSWPNLRQTFPPSGGLLGWFLTQPCFLGNSERNKVPGSVSATWCGPHPGELLCCLFPWALLSLRSISLLILAALQPTFQYLLILWKFIFP